MGYNGIMCTNFIVFRSLSRLIYLLNALSNMAIYMYHFDRHAATIKEHHNYVEIKFYTTNYVAGKGYNTGTFHFITANMVVFLIPILTYERFQYTTVY